MDLQVPATHPFVLHIVTPASLAGSAICPVADKSNARRQACAIY